MTTKTTPAPSKTKTTPKTKTAPAKTPTAPKPGETLQDRIKRGPDKARATPDSAGPIEQPGDPNTVAFAKEMQTLRDTIARQSKAYVAQYAARGAIVRRAINIKTSKARNKAERNALRAAGLRAAELTAIDAYDPSAEAKPDMPRWLALDALVSYYPTAKNLPSLATALALATALTRVDPPAAWNSPDTYELKRPIDADAYRATIDRAIAEAWTKEQATTALDELRGMIETDAPKETPHDPIKTARDRARSILEAIAAQEINPETFFDELSAQLRKYGWSWTTANDGPALAPRLKIHKVAKTA